MPEKKKAPGWTIEILPRGGDPDTPSKRLMDLQFSDDMKTLKVERMGADGNLQTFEIVVEGPADVNRLFASEVVGMITAQANLIFRAQGLETTQVAPVSFTPEGHVLSEIHQRGTIFRRTVFDPELMQLTVTGQQGAVLSSTKVKDLAELPVVLAKTLGVKLPLSSNK
jgi:hypothetical protein